MTTRDPPRAPPGLPSNRAAPTDAPAAQESTALMERPLFSDDLGGGGGDDDKDVFSDDELPNLPEFGAAGTHDDDDEHTDPSKAPRPRASVPPLSKNHADGEAPTGRFALDDLDDLSLPSAHVSELDVSDLDGDVQEPGAPTAIMQLPPEMIGHADQANTDSGPHSAFEVRRWSAGPPPGALGARHDIPVPGPPPPSAEQPSSTLPALSLDAIRAAAEGLHDVAAPPPASRAPGLMPLPPAPHTSPMAQQTTSLHAEDLSRAAPPGALRALVEEALSAVTGAQTAVGGDDAVVERQLSRAVQALSRLLDHVD